MLWSLWTFFKEYDKLLRWLRSSCCGLERQRSAMVHQNWSCGRRLNCTTKIFREPSAWLHEGCLKDERYDQGIFWGIYNWTQKAYENDVWPADGTNWKEKHEHGHDCGPGMHFTWNRSQRGEANQGASFLNQADSLISSEGLAYLANTIQGGNS